ncbi:MAG: fumarate hydratase C-terminal domain-containing protein [Methanomassiliicoccales archaeon]|nr:MAG: fumarate hydratase C-terminal domain-containing protein [Methanomassiliicoccales archaeon]
MKLTTPLDEDSIRELKIGDVVSLSGTIFTARDEAHIRALEYKKEGKDIPVEFTGSAVFHCGPIMQKEGDTWHLVAAGPTTSSRMNSLEPEFIKTFGARAIIGKGGMSRPTLDAMKSYGCVYLAITGGAALLAAKGITSVKDVHWLDIGMPEALWVLEAEGFGPLIVAMDSQGNSLYENVESETKHNIKMAKQKLGLI